MPRLTKKQLKVLNKAELRKLAISGMDLEIARAYGATENFLIDFIFGDVDTFLGVNVSNINKSPTTGKPYFREGISEYITQLQNHIKGDQADAPTWPPQPTPQAKKVEETTEEEVATATVRRVPSRRTVGRKVSKTKAAPKVETKAEETTETAEAAEEAEVEVKTEETLPEVEQVSSPSPVDLTPVISLIEGFKADLVAYNEKLDGVVKEIESIKRYAAAGKKSHKQVGNALLWLANNLTVDTDEGEEFFKETTDFPPPSEYIEESSE